MRKRIQTRKGGSRFGKLLPRGRRERRKTELLGGAAGAVFGVLIICVFVLSSAQSFLLRSPNVAAVVSAVLVDLANGDRTQQGLATLKLNPVLVAAAQAKANDMAEKSYFAHVSPQGVDPWFWFKQAGYNFNYAGENLAVDFSDSGEVNSAWMNSPTHRENILDPHFTEIGIAVAEGMYQGHPTTFVVQEFGAPAETRQAQAPVQQTIPKNPTQPALATTQPTQVLGSSVEETPSPQKPAPKKLAVATPKPTPTAVAVPVVATTSPALAATLAKGASESPPWWSFLVSFPRDTLRYAYYLLGLLILGALAMDTGFEMRLHHARRALTAGTLLATMCVLFIVADYLFFAQPVLALSAALFGSS